jgi:hypothetical protein
MKMWKAAYFKLGHVISKAQTHSSINLVFVKLPNVNYSELSLRQTAKVFESMFLFSQRSRIKSKE